LRTAGRVEEAASFGDRVAALLATRIPDGAGLQSAQGWFHLQRGLTLTILGRHDPAAHCYESSWRHASESGARQISANAAANMALTQALAGRPDSARRWLDRFHSHVGDHWSTYLVGLGASLADGLLALDAHDMRGAQAAIDRIGDDGTAELELWPYIAHLRAQCALLHADAPTALASFDAAVAAHRHRLLDYENAGPLVSRARLDLLVAAGYAERAVAAAPPAYTRDPVLMAPAARISLLTGNAIGARRIVATCLDSEPLTPRQRLELLLIDASAAARLGDDDSARAVAVRAHDIATSAGIQTAFSTISARDRGSLAALGVEVGAPRPGWASAYPDELTVVLLTRSEQALLRALEITDSRQQIAAQLFVSHNTIKSQLSRLYRKLNARTRDEALLKAHQLGLV
jgi:LuxR family maltose regulon positive regulatory protein